MFCPKCGKEVDRQDKYCKFCGALLEEKPTPFYLKGWFIIIMAFVVLGPFVIPLLWKSPDFSKEIKYILTVVIIIYTLILLSIPYLFLRKVYQYILGGYYQY